VSFFFKPDYKNSPFFWNHQIFEQKNAFFLYFLTKKGYFFGFNAQKKPFLMAFACAILILYSGNNILKGGSKKRDYFCSPVLKKKDTFVHCPFVLVLGSFVHKLVV
jgi:hypothetical protein